MHSSDFVVGRARRGEFIPWSIGVRALGAVALALASVAPAHAVTVAWTTIGNPGNKADVATGHGSLPYTFRIGTRGVTCSQYVEFLNAKDPTGANALGLWDDPTFEAAPFVLRNLANAEGSRYYVVAGAENYATSHVSYISAMRFANWMNNGQGDADTENGAYHLGPLGAGGFPLSLPGTITRDLSASIFLPSEEEWYKAAYYNPTSLSYSQYPGNPSAYGAFDMGAFWHWTETSAGGWNRIIRGPYPSDDWGVAYGTEAWSIVGFRLASVPEPSTFLLVAMGAMGVGAGAWRRKANPVRVVAMLLLAACLAAGSATAAEPRTFYHVTDLTDGYPYLTGQSRSNDINNSGRVVGGDFYGYRGFTSQDNITYDTYVLADIRGPLTAVNDLGDMVGRSDVYPENGGLEFHAVMYDGTTVTDLGDFTVTGSSGFRAAYFGVEGINDSRQVAGWYYDFDANWSATTAHAFVIDNGVRTDLGSLGGSRGAQAFDINNAGVIVGESYTAGDQPRHAFVYQNGTMTDLGTLPGGAFSSAQAVNQAGQIVGSAGDAGGYEHAMIYSGGTMTDLGTLGGTYSAAADVNNHGQIVGTSALSTPGQYDGFIYSGGQMQAISPLLDSSATGFGQISPNAINDSGQIAGTSAKGAVLLTPTAGIHTPLVVDPAQSFVTLTADVNGGSPVEAQSLGSMSSALGGTLSADLVGTNGHWSEIRFLADGVVTPVGHAGPFQPVNGPADFAGTTSLDLGIGDGPVPLDLALRNSTFNLSSEFTKIYYHGAIDLFHTGASMSSTLDYNLTGLKMGSGQLAASSLLAGAGKVEQIGDTLYVTIPFDVTYSTKMPGLAGRMLNLHYTGQIVATAAAVTAVPEPSTWALAALGSVGLASFVRRRQRGC